MADRIAIMMGGRLLQVAAPDRIYRDPDHLDVAEFVGSPKINVIAAEMGPDGVARRDGIPLADGFGARGPLRLAVRPEHLALEPEGRAGALPVRLERLEFHGSEILAHLRLRDGPERLVARLSPQDTGFCAGQVYGARAASSAWLAFARDGARLRRADAAPQRSLRPQAMLEAASG